MINSNVCRKAYTKLGAPDAKLERIGVRFNEINFVCELSDSMEDLCNTPGLNYYGCLLT